MSQAWDYPPPEDMSEAWEELKQAILNKPKQETPSNGGDQSNELETPGNDVKPAQSTEKGDKNEDHGAQKVEEFVVKFRVASPPPAVKRYKKPSTTWVEAALKSFKRLNEGGDNSTAEESSDASMPEPRVPKYGPFLEIPQATEKPKRRDTSPNTPSTTDAEEKHNSGPGPSNKGREKEEPLRGSADKLPIPSIIVRDMDSPSGQSAPWVRILVFGDSMRQDVTRTSVNVGHARARRSYGSRSKSLLSEVRDKALLKKPAAMAVSSAIRQKPLPLFPQQRGIIDHKSEGKVSSKSMRKLKQGEQNPTGNVLKIRQNSRKNTASNNTNPTISWDSFLGGQGEDTKFETVCRTGYGSGYPMDTDDTPTNPRAANEERGYQHGNWLEDLPYEPFNEGEVVSSAYVFNVLFRTADSRSDASTEDSETNYQEAAEVHVEAIKNGDAKMD